MLSLFCKATIPLRNAEEEENKEQWVVDIETKYRSYNPGEHDEKNQRKSIYKWPNDLVAMSTLSHLRAPRMVSLGPYHHGKEHLQPMDHHKERALHRILHRSNIPLSRFIQSLRDVQQELWDSYDNLDPKLSPHFFLRMMLFDGCFLLELLRSGSEDSIFKWEGLSMVGILVDMLLLENQIPLLVLEKLLVVEEGNNHKDPCLLIAEFYNLSHKHQGPCLHILDIYRKSLIGDSRERVENETPISVCSHFQSWLHLAGKGVKRMLIALPILVFWLLHGAIPKQGHFRTATRLHEAGIKFKKGEPGLTITFDEKNGVLTLPYIKLYDEFPIIYMNVVTFERMHRPLFQNQKVAEYLTLMDHLIDTADDVSVLCSHGIVSNFLPSDEDAAKLFNAYSNALIVDSHHTETLSNQWQCYAASDWNLAIAHLKHNYFQSPWSVVSLLAAIIFLVLTIIQTVFSGMEALK